jgi:hypothetical protein
MAQKNTAQAGASAPAEDVTNTSAKPAEAQVISLTRDRQRELATLAARSGAPEDAVGDLQRLLASSTLTAGTLADVERKLDEMAAERLKRCGTYYVRKGSRVRFHGKSHGPGDKMRLTPDEAAEMADMVHNEPLAPPQPAVEKRPHGRYRVRGPGSVKHKREFHRPGAILDLEAEQARSLGDAVEYIHPEPKAD